LAGGLSALGREDRSLRPGREGEEAFSISERKGSLHQKATSERGLQRAMSCGAGGEEDVLIITGKKVAALDRKEELEGCGGGVELSADGGGKRRGGESFSFLKPERKGTLPQVLKRRGKRDPIPCIREKRSVTARLKQEREKVVKRYSKKRARLLRKEGKKGKSITVISRRFRSRLTQYGCSRASRMDWFCERGRRGGNIFRLLE